jgi:hypothetical protein
MDRKLQHTIRLKADLGNTEGANMLLNINHLVIAIKENYVKSIKHPDGVNAVGWDDPKALPRAGPSTCGPQQTHETAEVAVSDCSMSGNEALTGLIVNTDVFPSVKCGLAHWGNLANQKYRHPSTTSAISWQPFSGGEG